MNRPRRIATVVHRYTGLAIALFVAITGLTGAVIAWNDQLERVFAPSLFVLPDAAARRPPLDVFALREAGSARAGSPLTASIGNALPARRLSSRWRRSRVARRPTMTRSRSILRPG